jgi:hypothetical protein
MTYIKVNPGVLRDVATRLIESSAVAREVKDDRDGLKDRVSDEHDVVRGAVESFLDEWAYGCECLLEDADQTSTRLSMASECYLEVEDVMSEGFSRDG